MNGLESRTSPLTRALTSFLLKSHGMPVRGSLRVRSRLHPGFNVVPPYVLRAASCTILGCEYTSDTSAPISSYSLRAPSIVSSTLMSSAFFMRLCNSLLGVSLTMQSSMILPVVRLLMILLCTSCSCGPPFEVVIRCRDFGNVLANTPDPMCLHDRSALSMGPPGCIGPGCWARLDRVRLAMSSALPSVLAVSSCSSSFLFCPLSAACCTGAPLFMRSSSSALSSASLFRPLGEVEPLAALSASSPESPLLRFRLALTPSSNALAFWMPMSALLSPAVAPEPLAAFEPSAVAPELAAASISDGSIAIARFVIPSSLLSAARSKRSFDFAFCRRSCSKRFRHSKVCWFRPFPV